MNLRAFFGAGMLLLSGGALQAQRPDSAPAATLLHLQVEWHRAYVAGDSLRLDGFLAPNAEVVRSTGVVLDRARIITQYRGRDTAGLGITTDEQVAEVADSLALVVARVAERDRGVLRFLRVADLFERRGGDWRLRHSQWTLLPGLGEASAVDPAALSALAGRYEDERGRVLTVDTAGTRLRVRTAGGNEYYLLPRSGEQFFRAGELGEWIFPRRGTEPPAYAVVVVVQSATLLRRIP